jgi:hypothetical protein
MHRIRTLLAASSMTAMVITQALVPGVAHANPRGFMFMRINDPKEQNPHTIAAWVRASLKQHPNGDQPINPEMCARDRDSCATAHDYLVAINGEDKKANLQSVNDVADFLDDMDEVRPDPKASYKSACRTPTEVIIDCAARPFAPNERAWRSKRTGKIDFMGKCSNPVGEIEEDVRVEVSCPTIETNSDEGDEIRVFVIGTKEPSKDCWALREAGEDEFTRTLPRDCPERIGLTVCDAADDVEPVRKLIGRDVELREFRASWKSQVKGHNVLQVTREALTNPKLEIVVCRRTKTGQMYMALGVRNIHYVNGHAILEDKYWLPVR